MKFISKINTIFTPEFLDEMFDLYKQHKFYVKDKSGKDVLVHDTRHIKALKFRDKLSKYFEKKSDISFNFLGDGTNRMAFLVDGYVFKLALDDQGYIDNLTEFKMSREAQPYVTKTYETNGLFCVAEYVTLISYDEFVKQKMRILEILETLSSEYLLGDMGWTKKNYCNWGYRQNSKDLVILDYGHMMKIDQNKMICTECGSFLSYNSTYTEIECISCHKKMDFMSMKSKISKKEEMQMIDDYLNKSVQTSEPTIEIDDSEFIVEENHHVEEVDEMVSNQFESLKPKTHKKFADLMDDSYEDLKSEDEEIPDFNKVMTFMNSNVPEPQPEDMRYQRIEGVPDPLLRSLILMDDRDEAEFTLSQYLTTGRIEMYQYMHYMDSLNKYYDGPRLEDKDGLSTIGEIIKTKKPVDDEEPQDEDPEVDPYMAYYNGLLYTEEKKVYATPIEEEPQEVSEEDMKMMSQMKKLLYMDDDPEDLFPEDFLEKNAESLGFNEEDSPEDEAKYDKVLANIKKVNNTEMDELEDEMEEEEPDNIESYQEMILEVIGPENESSTKQEVEEDDPENVINLSKQSVVDDNGIFKVQRGQNGEVIDDSGLGTIKVHRSGEILGGSESGTIKVQKSEEAVTNSESGIVKVQKSEETETNSESGIVKVQKSEESIVTNDDSDAKVNVNKIDDIVNMKVGEMKVENLSLMEKVFNQMKENE